MLTASVNKIALDTSILLDAIEFKIDVFTEIKNKIGAVEFIVPAQVMDELDEISLCNGCYCMTKTIEGKCGKCKYVKDKSEEIKDLLDVGANGVINKPFNHQRLYDEVKKIWKRI